jgi:hypothetical protein
VADQISEAALSSEENRKTKTHTINPVQFLIKDSIVAYPFNALLPAS